VTSGKAWEAKQAEKDKETEKENEMENKAPKAVHDLHTFCDG
jgi:hypothetical protein